MRVSNLTVFLLTLSSCAIVEGRIFGLLHRHDSGDDQEDPPLSNADRDNDEDGANLGLFIGEDAMRTGRRGFACLQYAANVENDPFGDLGVLSGAMTRVLLNYFGEERLNMICASTEHGRKLLAEERGEEESIVEESMETTGSNYSAPFENEARRTRSCATTTAVYPTNPKVDKDGAYSGYSSLHYARFFPNGNMNRRSDTPTIMKMIGTEIAELQQVRQDLTRCSNIWRGINQGIGVIDIPFVDPESISEAILAFSCELANDYNDIVISRKNRELERLRFHDQLIDSAETKAGYDNTKTILADLCSVSESVNIMRLEMEVIDAST